jgi:hypothetical protein
VTQEFIDEDVDVKRKGSTALEDQGRRVRFRSEGFRSDESPTRSPTIEVLHGDTPVPPVPVPTFAPRPPNPSFTRPTPPPAARTPTASPSPSLDDDIPMHEAAAAAKEKKLSLGIRITGEYQHSCD